MARVEDQLTPVTPGEVLQALGNAWRAQFGAAAHRTSLLVLVAQWALETGRGRSMHCYNLGNVKSNGQSGDWCFFRCNEIIDGQERWFEPDHPACRFRAFATLDAGAVDYLRTLHARFDRAWPAVLDGDPQAFSRLLRQQRYYTADEGQYTRTLVSLFNEFSRSLAPPLAAEPDLYSTRGLQQALAVLGYQPGAIDGIEGPKTTAAICRFQAASGLVVDGIVGRFTRAALLEAWRQHHPG